MAKHSYFMFVYITPTAMTINSNNIHLIEVKYICTYLCSAFVSHKKNANVWHLKKKWNTEIEAKRNCHKGHKQLGNFNPASLFKCRLSGMYVHI